MNKSSDFLDAIQREIQEDRLCYPVQQVSSQISEDPSLGIYQAIIHHLYLQTCDLYRLPHPRFYPGPQTKAIKTEEVYPSPLTGPVYRSLAISAAVEEFRVIPGF
jgi:hypothetical protein